MASINKTISNKPYQSTSFGLNRALNKYTSDLMNNPEALSDENLAVIGNDKNKVNLTDKELDAWKMESAKRKEKNAGAIVTNPLSSKLPGNKDKQVYMVKSDNNYNKEYSETSAKEESNIEKEKAKTELNNRKQIQSTKKYDDNKKEEKGSFPKFNSYEEYYNYEKQKYIETQKENAKINPELAKSYLNPELMDYTISHNAKIYWKERQKEMEKETKDFEKSKKSGNIVNEESSENVDTNEQNIDADKYFASNQTAAEKVDELVKAGYTKDDVVNYFEKLYSGKGGLSENAINAINTRFSPKKESPKKEKPISNKSESTDDKKDSVSLTKGKTSLGNKIDEVYNNLSNEQQKEDIEKAINRYNEGYKKSVGDDFGQEMKDAYGARWELLKNRPISTLADYLGTAMMNASHVINKTGQTEKSRMEQVDQETLNGALQRYNDKRNKMLDDDIALLGDEYKNDQKLRWQLKELYANKELERAIQNLSVENKKALLKAYKEVADSGFFGTTPTEIITNVLKIGATQGAMDGGLPQAVSQVVSSAGNAVGGLASGLGNSIGTLFNFFK